MVFKCSRNYYDLHPKLKRGKGGGGRWLLGSASKFVIFIKFNKKFFEFKKYFISVPWPILAPFGSALISSTEIWVDLCIGILEDGETQVLVDSELFSGMVFLGHLATLETQGLRNFEKNWFLIDHTVKFMKFLSNKHFYFYSEPSYALMSFLFPKAPD